ncbi:MAG: DUF4870 domain-containing protein [Chloroflexi bacterium]|nr:DUF4870 domain-containing protein [Chloroflexota bacterium]
MHDARPPYPVRAPEPARAPSLGAHIRRKATEHVDQRIAAVSHLSIGFGIVIGVGFLVGIAINLIIWLRSKRSPVVAFHAEQAGAYQLAVLIVNILTAAVWIGVTVLLMGGSELGAGEMSMRQLLMGLWCALVPLFALWFFGTIAYGLYGGLVVAAGRDFSYPIFGPWARKRVAQGK